MNENLDDRTKEAKEAFDMFDASKQGKVSNREFTNILKALGYTFTENEIRNIIGEFDRDGDGKLTFEELMNFLNSRSKELETEDELIEAFKIFDREGRGFIGKDEIKHILLQLGESMTPEELEEIVNQADIDGDGKVSYQDFVKLLLMK